MVGVAIGMIGMIVMIQVLMVSDGSKRTTAGGGDAQINGTGALHAMALGIRQSGHGMSSPKLAGCTLTLRNNVRISVLTPVTINHPDIPQGDSGSDTVLIAYGNSGGSPEGDLVTLQPASSTYAVTAPMSFSAGNWVVARPANAGTCALRMESVITRTEAPPNVTIAIGTPDMVGGTLFNLGSAPQFLAYAVRRGNLTVCDYTRADCANANHTTDDDIWNPVASGIVNLRAQYGRDTAPAQMDAIVDGFDQNSPGVTTSASGMPLHCAVVRILAVRLVLVARNGSLEKTEVTPATPEWSGSSGAPINLSADDLWQRYRYKLFETVVPLRNLVPLGAQPGC